MKTPPPTFYLPEHYEKNKLHPPAPTLPPETRDQLTSLMQELLLKTHELSFEYSTSDCEEITQCPLAKQSRELFKTVKKLHRIVRQVSPPPKTSYVS